MSHLSERAIGLYAIDPARVSAREAAHLGACDDCRAALRELHSFEELLRDPESWLGVSEAVPRAGDDELRAFAVRSAEEDEEALRLLEEFREPAAAARFVWTDVANKPEYRTGGVARLLCRWANGMCERDPLYALKLAEAATSISQTLPDQSYPRKTIHELRGEALKEQANALRFLGRFPDALRAIAHAEAEYSELNHETAGLAAVKFVRGCILYEQEDLEAAEKAAHDAADAALRTGAADKHISARNLLGYILSDRQEHEMAARVFEESLRYREAEGDSASIARDSLSVGLCYLELSRLPEASRFLHEALRRFTELGSGPEVTRTHWALARLIFAEGNASEAIYRLRRCVREFAGFEILTDAALVAIDLAEILNTSGRAREISKVLAGTVETFMQAGKLTSALTALAYLKDASASGTMTPQVVAYVRRFVQRADRQPELLFLPPPEAL
jgi:tetratricopeptide (TPR) repeat protein